MIRESLKPASSRGIGLGFLELMKTLNEFRKLLGPLYNIDVIRRGETSSANGNCSARGLAKLAAVMATKETLGGLLETNFTQGGVNKFEEEGGRDGYYGW